MASVTSLDKDMRKLRMDRYTPQAANEVRSFIEESLGERLAGGDLLDALKDGVALCKYGSCMRSMQTTANNDLTRLVNLAVPNPIRFKAKAVMPFVQMENISLFLDACKSPPINLQSHDMFLTVDLFESKDPAQVLQCLGSFSRAANRLQPSRFPNPIGGKRSGVVSPQGTGTPTVGGGSYGNRGRGVSNASNTSSAYNTNARPASSITPTRTGDSNSGRWSPTKSTNGPVSPGSVSSWSKKSDEGATAPAWNIAQYGYMGGASQGNLGVSFGGRRQITSASPHVPSMAEKEKKRREKAAEEERLRLEAEDAERRRQEEQVAAEETARIEEEERWAEETRRLREQEKQKAEEEKRKWEEEERRWKMDEERRQREEQDAEAKLQTERTRARGTSDARLRGQFLSQYQAENGVSKGSSDTSESSRIKELERELELARETRAPVRERKTGEIEPTQSSSGRGSRSDGPGEGGKCQSTPSIAKSTLDCHLARTATKYGAKTSGTIFASNGTHNIKTMAPAHHLLQNPLVPYQNRLYHHGLRRTTQAHDHFLTQRHTQHLLRLHLKPSPQAKAALIDTYLLTPLLKRPSQSSPILTRLADSTVQLNETPKIVGVCNHSRRRRQAAGHPSRCSSERWRWNGKGSKNGRKVRKKSKPRLPRAMVWMALEVVLAANGM